MMFGYILQKVIRRRLHTLYLSIAMLLISKWLPWLQSQLDFIFRPEEHLFRLYTFSFCPNYRNKINRNVKVHVVSIFLIVTVNLICLTVVGLLLLLSPLFFTLSLLLFVYYFRFKFSLFITSIA